MRPAIATLLFCNSITKVCAMATSLVRLRLEPTRHRLGALPNKVHHCGVFQHDIVRHEDTRMQSGRTAQHPGRRRGIVNTHLARARVRAWALAVRGGYVGGRDDGHGDDDDDDDAALPKDDRMLSAALAACYFTVMGAKCALPSVLPLLTDSAHGLTFPATSSPSAASSTCMATLLRRSTLALMAGKLVLGPGIDYVGGLRALQVMLALLLTLLAVIAGSQQFVVFAAGWMGVDFVFSSCWAGCIHAVRQVSDSKGAMVATDQSSSWSRQIGLLAAAARLGNASAFAFFAAVLHFCQGRLPGCLHRIHAQPWRAVFGLAALAQLLPLTLITVYGQPYMHAKQHATTDDGPTISSLSSMRTSLTLLRRVARTMPFWLHMINRSVLMIFASFLLFVPTLQTHVYGATATRAAQSGALFALGCLASVTWLGGQYKRQDVLSDVTVRNGRLRLLSWLMGGATLASLAQLGHVAGQWRLNAMMSTASLLVWGFCVAVPFYIPPSLYALSEGGTQSSATIADVFDIGGFGLLAGFNGYVAGIAHATPSAWIPTFAMTTACAVISWACLAGTIVLESRPR